MAKGKGKKGNGKGNQKKKKSSSGGARKKAPMNMSGVMSTAMGVCSVTNPFCPEAKGGRWPDNSHTKSAAFTIDAKPFGLATDANGTGAAMFFPTLNYQLMATSGIVGAAITWSTTNTAAETITGVGRYRLTSWGIKIQTISAPMTTTGMCRVRLFSPMGGTSLGSSSLTSTLADNSIDITMASLITKPLHVIPMPLGAEARIFQNPTYNGTVSTWVNPGWQVIQVGIDGGPASTTMLNVTMYYHYEVIFNDGDTQTTFATAPPRDSAAVRNGNSGVLESVGNFFDGAAGMLDKVIKNRATKYLMSAAVGGYTGNPNAAAGMFQLMDGPRNVD